MIFILINSISEKVKLNTKNQGEKVLNQRAKEKK